MILDNRSLSAFFLLVSLTYALTPTVSSIFFGYKADGLMLFTLIALFMIFILVIMVAFLPRYFILDAFELRTFPTIVLGGALLFLVMGVLISIYGSLQSAIISPYQSRTGVLYSGIASIIYNPLLVFISAYNGLVISHILFFRTPLGNSYSVMLALVPFLFLLIFLISGNRNLILWSISLPMAIWIGRRSLMSIFFLLAALVFLSVLAAAFRNFGLANISNFSFPDAQYWNPIVHEYGTTFRVFDLLVNKDNEIRGFTVYGQSYLDTFLNFLPSWLKPEGYQSFSTAISSQYAKNGEGLGGSPVAEVILNGYFPAVIIQTLPILFLFFFTRLRRGQKNFRFSEFLKYAALAGLIIACFNFWRIGFSELSKIILSITFGYFVVFRLVVKRKSSNFVARSDAV